MTESLPGRVEHNPAGGGDLDQAPHDVDGLLVALRRALWTLHPSTIADDGTTLICATCVNLGEHDSWPCATLLTFELPICEHGVIGGGHWYPADDGDYPEWCEHGLTVPHEDKSFLSDAAVRCPGPDVAAAVLAAVTPPTPKWRGYDAALLWELLLNDSDEERHTRLTGLIAAAAEMAGAQEEASRLADQGEALRIELDETRAQQRCECGKPLSHLYAQSDSPDWACRVPTNERKAQQ